MRHRHHADQVRHGCRERHHHPGELAHVRPDISTHQRNINRTKLQYIHDHARARPTHKARTNSRSAVEERREVPCNIFSHLACEKEGVKMGCVRGGRSKNRTSWALTFIGAAFSGSREEKKKEVFDMTFERWRRGKSRVYQLYYSSLFFYCLFFLSAFSFVQFTKFDLSVRRVCQL